MKDSKNVWVYAGTERKYEFEFDESTLQQKKINSRTRLIKSGILPVAGNKSVTLECVTKKTQKARAKVWVYAGTGTEYRKRFNVSELQQTIVNPVTRLPQYGILHAAENQQIALELISKRKQALRIDEVWVYAGTGIEYEGPVHEGQLEKVRVNQITGIVQSGILRLQEGQSVRIERISRRGQKGRAGAWVYAGTGIKYEGSVDVGQLSEIEFHPVTGLIQSGLLYSTENKCIRLEYVSSYVQHNRASRVWVYADTGIKYEKSFDESQLQQTKSNPKSGLIQEGRVLGAENQWITLEFITKPLQNKRLNNVWVYEGTGELYEHPFDVRQLQNPKINLKTRLIQSGTLYLSENNQITLELIHKNLQRERAATLWVYAGTGMAYEGPVDERQFQETKINPRNGLIQQGMLLVAENKWVHLELITKAAQRHRVNRVWVYEGTHRIYEETFDVQQLQQTQVNSCDGSIKRGYLYFAESPPIVLESVTRDVQRWRADKMKKNIVIDEAVPGEHQEINWGFGIMSPITFFGNALSTIYENIPGIGDPLDASKDNFFERMNFN